MIGDLDLYRGREQAYVKHFLLSEYVETWAHKVGSHWTELAYVDGFSGPWQNADEGFADTSFGIALGALTRAKATWTGLGRPRKVSALGLILATSATALARDVGEALLNAVKRTGDAKTPWGLQTLSSSLVVWATLVAFRLKPLHDAFSALTNRRAVEL